MGTSCRRWYLRRWVTCCCRDRRQGAAVRTWKGTMIGCDRAKTTMVEVGRRRQMAAEDVDFEEGRVHKGGKHRL